MEVFLKRFGYGVGALIGLLLAIFAIAPSFVDWSQYRNEIALQVEGLVGRPVTIEGDLAFTILPSPALSVNGLRIANVPGASTVDLVTLQSLDIEVAFLPLLRGVIQVERTVLVGPVINLEILPGGRNSWDQPDRLVAETGDGSSSSGFQVTLDNLQIKDGKIAYVDVSSDTNVVLDNIDTAISAKSIMGPFTVQGQLDFGEISTIVDLSIGSMVKPRFSVDAQIGVPEEGLKAHLSGVGYTDDTDLIFDGEVEATVDDARALMGNGESSKALSRGTDLSVTLSGRAALTNTSVAFEDVDITYGSVKGHGEFGVDFANAAKYRAIISLPVINLDALMEDVGAMASTDDEDASFALPEGVNASLDVAIEGVRYQGKLARQLHLTASLSEQRLAVKSLRALLPGGSDLSVSGVLTARGDQPDFKGQMRAGSSNLRNLLTAFEFDLTAIPKDRLTQMIMRSALTMSGNMIQLTDVELKIDTTTLTGGIAYSLGQERPSFGINLVADRFNADFYRLPPDAENPESFDFVGMINDLAGVDVNSTLRVDQMTFDRETIAGLTANISLDEDGMQIKSLDVDDVAGAVFRLSEVKIAEGSELAAVGSLTIETDDLPRFRRFIGYSALPIEIDALRLDLVSSFAIAGGDIDIDGQAMLDGSKLTLRGNSAESEGQPAQLNMQIELQNNSWGEVSQLLGLPSVAPLAKADAPFVVRGTIVGTGDEYDLNLGAELGAARASISGSMTTSENNSAFNLNAEMQTDQLVSLSGALGADIASPKLEQAKLAISAEIVGTSDQFNVQKLKGNIGPSVFTGNIAADLSGDAPALDASFAFEKLDIGAFMGPADTGAKEARKNSTLRWSPDAIDLSGLVSVEADIGFTAKEMLFNEYRFTSPELKMHIGKAGLIVSQMTAKLFGGDMQVSGGLINAALPTLEVEFQLADASVAQALAAAADLTVATGKLTVSGKLKGAGISQKALVANLEGQVDLLAENGVVQGVNMVQMSDSMLTLVEYDDFIKLLRSAFGGGETKYESFHAPFVINSGIAITGPAMGILEASEATVNATINLPRWSIDADIDFRLTEEGHEKTPSVGLRIYGDIDSPQRKTKAGAMTSYIGRRLASRLLNDIGDGEGNSGLRQLLGAPATEAPAAEGEEEGTAAPAEEAVEPTPAAPGNSFDMLMQGLFNEIEKKDQSSKDPAGN